MGTPLTSITQKPIQYSTYAFGGDDTSSGKGGFFNAIAEWDRNATPDSCTAHFIFFVKKSFEFLDSIGIGTCAFGLAGFKGQLEQAEFLQTGLDRNRQAREKIVTSLGGEAECQRIPVVNINQADFTDYMKLGDEYFRGGQWVVQAEDPAGRKVALLRLANRAGQIFTGTVQQRYRETCIDRIHGSGDRWTVNISDNRWFPVNTDQAAEFVQQVRANRHPEFTIAPKP